MQGVRVLDFGQYIAGPAAAAILGDLGAEVVHIDPPGGPRWSAPAARCLDRGKQQCTIDLKSSAGLREAQDWIARADVLIENFRPGVMERLGLGAEACVARNPTLIYLSLPGFASNDTERCTLRAWEAVIAAESGQFSDMGLSRVLMGVQPSFTPLTLASAYGAMFGVAAVCSALFHRTRTGRGARIEVPLATALMEGLVYNSMHVERYPDRYKTLREQEITRRTNAGETFDMGYAELQEFLDPFYRSYMCADGRPIHVVNTSHRQHVHRMLGILDLLDAARAAGVPELPDWYRPTAEWPAGVDCALGLYPLPRRWVEWFTPRLQAKFLEKPAFEWEQIFGAAGVPVVAHRTSEEWLNSNHALASGLVHEYEDAELRQVRQAGPVVWLESSAQQVASYAPMVPLRDGTDVWGTRSAGEVRATASIGGWLDGVRILDLTNVIAGPTVAATLARFGAEVIKLDAIQPNFDPWNTIVFGMQAGRGKRSILLDVKSTAGRKVLHDLVRWADVITVNKVMRQLRSLGLDTESLAQVNPRVILMRLDAFGGPQPGPKSDHVGYDDLAQAMTGVMARFGGSLETPEEHAHLGTIDVLCGIAGAAGAAAALAQREMTG